MHEHDYAVIMAGGGGTRLWPVSRLDRPKQLLPLLGEETLFQSTVSRLMDLFPAQRILVVTIAQQAQEMQRQAEQIPAENYLLEPTPRGTAAAIGLAAMVLRNRDPEALMVALPADHFIRNRGLFKDLMQEALEVARESYLVTLGITPVRPSSAYGYIQHGEPIQGKFRYPVYRVRKFTEKPDEATAQEYLRTRDHSWNSGMFVWRVDAILGEFESQMPVLASALQQISKAWGTASQVEVLSASWSRLMVETIDYGVMERATQVVVMPAGDLGWNDVGSWNTLFDVLPSDIHGNVWAQAQHLSLDTHSTLVYGHDAGRLIVTIGMDDTVIVDAPDVLLVCKADQAEMVRDVVERLRNQGQERYL